MSDDNTTPEVAGLIAELDDLGDEFAAEAERNRALRRDRESDERQDTYGDQPEREFQPEVFLTVPHNHQTPGTAAFTDSVYSGVEGSVVQLGVTLEDTSTAWVTVGSPDVNYEVTFRVVDGSSDGTVTVSMDTAAAGDESVAPGSVFSAGTGDSVRNFDRAILPDSADLPLDPGSYDLSVAVQSTTNDVATVEIQEEA